VLRDVLEATDTSVGPEDLSHVAEIVRDTGGACLRHPCGLRLCQTYEYTVCFLPPVQSVPVQDSTLVGTGVGHIRGASGDDGTRRLLHTVPCVWSLLFWRMLPTGELMRPL